MDYPPGDEHGYECCCLECQAVRDHLAAERLDYLRLTQERFDREREHRLRAVLTDLNKQRQEAH